MADTKPRSFSQIFGLMLDTFRSKTGLKRLTSASPVLAIFFAAAQSDVRSSQADFEMANAQDLDNSKGQKLDRIGNSENVPRLKESSTTGLVTVGDSNYTKISTKISLAKPAPILGTDKVYVVDASDFSSSGEIYVGRGTSNYEGPLTYTSKSNLGTYWLLQLDSGSHTQRFHGQQESVVLAQGGNRTIASGTLIQTPQGNFTTSAQYSVLYPATIPDGEVEVSGVTVIATKPGINGNAEVGAVSQFVSDPFPGATVTNPLPFTNGRSTEKDDSYRERIRNSRQSKATGTALALKTGALGAVASDENKRVTSVSLVKRQNRASTLIIDDGTGYEERSQGVAVETLMDSATGGETDFQVSLRPVAKAYQETSLTAPFQLANGMSVAFKIGGVRSEHSFASTSFDNIASATAYEVSASVNANPELLFSARTSESGTKVVFYSREETNEDIENVAADGVDANDYLGVTSGRHYTFRLYKNDRLLNKDGVAASVESEPQSAWLSMSSPMTMLLDVDGTGTVTYSFTDTDFVNADTGYVSLAASNSLESWAAVFNSKIPGVTTAETGGRLTLGSNLGASGRSLIRITGGTLVTAGMFSFNTADALESVGAEPDYTLNRNTGQLTLSTALTEGDTLALGSSSTRAFIESDSISTVTLDTDAILWFCVDGGTEIVETDLVGSTTVTFSSYSTTPPQTWGNRVRITAGSTPFSNVEVGDWAIFTDTGGFSAGNLGAFRVAYVTSAYFEIERPTGAFVADSSVAVNGGLIFVRTRALPQQVTIPAAVNYTASSLVDLFNAALSGATAATYQTTKFRVSTDTLGDNGDIAFLAQNTEAAKLGLTPAVVTNLNSHLPGVEAQGSEGLTPVFVNTTLASASGLAVVVTSATGINSGAVLALARDLPDADSAGGRTPSSSRYGSNTGFRTPVSARSGTSLTLRSAGPQPYMAADRVYPTAPLALGPEDDLTVVVDQDLGQRFATNLYRKTTPTSGSYSSILTLKDADNSNLTLATAFGTSFDWTDYAVYMQARAKSHAESGNTTKTILWRYVRHGSEGNTVRVRYEYPTAPEQAVSVSSDLDSTGYVNTRVQLPSGSARSGYTIRNSSKIGVLAATAGSLQTLTYILGFSISSAVRVVKLNYKTQTVNFVVGVLSGGTSGATATIVSDVDNGSTGTLTLTGITGTFIDGETITSGAGGSATADGTQYGYTTLTLDVATPGATDHGLNVADQVYVSSSSGSFVSGIKTLVAKTTTTASYVDTATIVGATANIGTLSRDAGLVTLDSQVHVADIANFGSTTGLPADYQRSVRVGTVADQYLSGLAETAISPSTVTTWYSVSDSDGISFFPLDTAANKASDIATAVNALAAVDDSTCPVTAVAVGSSSVATGQISKSSWEEFTTTSYYYNLSDGLNYVQSATAGTSLIDATFTLKDAVAASLGSEADWENEDVRLVPILSKSLSDYLDSSAAGGLPGSVETTLSKASSRLQLNSLTSGSGGAIQVQGGLGNAVSATVVGSGSLVGSYAVASILGADAPGLRGGHWVEVENSEVLPKNTFASGTVVSTIDGAGLFTLNSGTSTTKAWNWANTATGTIDGFNWQIEAQGRYTCFKWTGIGSTPVLTGIKEGDWVVISKGATTISSANTGTFRVIRCDTSGKAFWIENANQVEELVTADLWFLRYDSIMPGDKIVIGTTVLGAGNKKEYTVASIDSGSTWTFTVAETTATYSGSSALGTAANLVRCIEAQPSKLIKQIRCISPNQDDGSRVDVMFETGEGSTLISAAAGTQLTSLDKLGFDTRIAIGLDGYRYNTGLVAEVNKILYGDESDPATYPGLVSTGTTVLIQGPMIKRISVALALRIRSGTKATAIFTRVRSAVASVVNRLGAGESVAISALVTAAESVNGVEAVSVISPTFNSGNDLISVRSGEKAQILSLEQDISLSLIGA